MKKTDEEITLRPKFTPEETSSDEPPRNLKRQTDIPPEFEEALKRKAIRVPYAWQGCSQNPQELIADIQKLGTIWGNKSQSHSQILFLFSRSQFLKEVLLCQENLLRALKPLA